MGGSLPDGIRSCVADADELRLLELRLGRQHARQRLGIESAHEARMLGRDFHLARLEGSLTPLAIETALRLSGLLWRGRRNAERVAVRRHHVQSGQLPPAFDGFVILHLSDLHCDISPRAMARMTELLDTLSYDICVLTGDYRGATFGPDDAALAAIADLRPRLRGQVYGVLGNHDSTRMLLGLEKLQIRMLMNESEIIERGGQHIHLAGIDDAHFFRTHSIERAADTIPEDAFSILLSHTPEVYRHAARAGFNLMLSGHTHGGQLCLPRGVALTLMAKLPRRFGAGSWSHQAMQGYTSVGVGSSGLPVRFNCPPEITLHCLRRSGARNAADR
jgi:predicted MPP superfamily phosphohydrolase